MCVHACEHTLFFYKGPGAIQMLVKSAVNKVVGMLVGSHDTWHYTKTFRMKRQFVFSRDRRNKMT